VKKTLILDNGMYVLVDNSWAQILYVIDATTMVMSGFSSITPGTYSIGDWKIVKSRPNYISGTYPGSQTLVIRLKLMLGSSMGD
jgi:hypothetical protein